MRSSGKLNVMTGEIYNYYIFSKAVVFLLVAQASGEEMLTVSLYRVTRDGALIDWHFTPKHKELEHCEYVYGSVTDDSHQQVTRLTVSNKPIIDLAGHLHYNVTYYFRMVCYDKEESRYVSNTLNFTTGSDQDEVANYMPASNMENSPAGRSDIPYSVSLDAERTRSSNIILGAICGIIGFLIINITVVLAVRKYSHWHVRRRIILEIDDREYDGLEYLRDED